MSVSVFVGTVKGGFLLRSDEGRRSWNIEGPLFGGWRVTSSARGLDGELLVATASPVYGPAIHYDVTILVASLAVAAFSASPRLSARRVFVIGIRAEAGAPVMSCPPAGGPDRRR